MIEWNTNDRNALFTKEEIAAKNPAA